jgi:hypothetical protein
VARLRTPALVAAVTLVALLAPACALLPGGGPDPSPSPSATGPRSAAARPVQPLPSPVTLRVLTSNELTDINDVAVAAAAATNKAADISHGQRCLTITSPFLGSWCEYRAPRPASRRFIEIRRQPHRDALRHLPVGFATLRECA